MVQRFVLINIIVVLAVASLTGQTNSSIEGWGNVKDVLYPTALDTIYKLSSGNILLQSVKVYLRFEREDSRLNNYTLDHKNGFIAIPSQLIQELSRKAGLTPIIVTYRKMPSFLQGEYFLRKREIRTDSTKKYAPEIAPQLSSGFDDMFGSGIRKSGTIVRGFTIGTNRDMSINSGFRLQVSGKLANDLDITAVLTDENSPIQPEGYTQTLQELDKVFVDIRGKWYGATLGDFYLNIDNAQGGEFGRLTRKVQGAKGDVAYAISDSSRGSSSVFGATARGKFHTNQFSGIEGSQGPYRLIGKNGEQHIIVIAGTEKVFLNGELMVRGELNDYAIEYAAGEVVFTSKRLIRSDSRIVVDFEYTDRQYIRNSLGTVISNKLLDGIININALVYQEGDDQNSPIDVVLSDGDKLKLQNSGTNRFAASSDGVFYVGRDSISGFAKGQYVVGDTIINSRSYRILSFKPGDTDALYGAAFSVVDAIPPDSLGYRRVSAGHFEVAGLGIGEYLPIRFLPLPQLLRILNVNGTIDLGKSISVAGEYAGSVFNANRFSLDENVVMAGHAYNGTMRFAPTIDKVGTFDLALKVRHVDQSFIPADRLNEVEFNRNWNIDQAGQANEQIIEGSLKFNRGSEYILTADLGSLARQSQLHSNRYRIETSINDPVIPTLSYRLEHMKTDDDRTTELNTWLRQRGSIAYVIGTSTPFLRIENEKKQKSIQGRDSLEQGSFQFTEITSGISFQELLGFNFNAEMQFRREDSTTAGTFQNTLAANTQTLTAAFKEYNSFSTTLTLHHRTVEFSQDFKNRGNVNTDITVLRSFSRYAPFRRMIESELYYEASNKRTAQLERVYLRVQKGTGNYRYLGDLNGNGIADENEFEPVRFDGDYVVLMLAGDKLVPVVDLKTSLRFRFQPKKYFDQPSDLFEHILTSISSETYARIEERSNETETGKIYLLDGSALLNPLTTLSGTIMFTEDAFVFENAPDLSFRLRFSERKNLVQLVSGSERGYSRERSLRIRSQLVSEITNQTDIMEKTDNLIAPAGNYRLRALDINSMITDFSYKPEQAWEAGFVLEVTRIQDASRMKTPTADINAQTLRLMYSIPLIGQLRGQIQREETLLSNGTVHPEVPYSYEFTNGKVFGQSFLWQLSADYRIGKNFQITINYNGRSEGGNAPIHAGRAEARAYF
jgi:hypothetical protein